MKRAFSILEILVVISIMALVAAITVPAIKSLGRASSLNSSVQQLTGMLDLARQTAIAQNRTLEVRLYKLPEEGAPTATPMDYRGIQIFLVDYDTTAPTTKAEKLTAPTVILEDPVVSSLMDNALFPEQAAPAGDNISSIGMNYMYRSFRFKPDGSIDLPRDQEWTLTLVNKNDPVKSGGLPANYATVVLHPMTGRLKVTRP